MDKNKSRVDMLAAGRKKLQQYRQKKDVKASGSQGKSAKKSSKHEHPKQDTDASSTVVKATASSQVPEGDITAPDGSSTLHSTESLLHSEYDIVSVDPSSETITPETGDVGNSLAHDADSAREPETIQQDADSSVPNSDDRAQNADASRTIETTSSDQKIKTDGMLNEAVSVAAFEETPVTLKTESVIEHEGQDPLPTEEYIPDISSFQARRDQVGAMQGADFLGSEQLDERSGAQLEGSLLAASTELHKNAKAFEAESVGENSVEGVSSKEEQEGDTDNASATAVATKFSDSDGTLDATQITLQPNEEAVSVTSVMECPEVLPAFGDSACEGHLLCLPESPSISKDRSQEAPLMIKGTSVSKEATPLAVGSVYPISLEQLLNVIQGLREDDYRFLLKSREAAMHANMGNCYAASSSFPDLLERLKEELYLTNFTKDIFKLQLAEHSDMQTESYQQHDQLVREIAFLRASLNEVHERSACSEEELSNSRSELQAIAGERQELQKQLQTAMAEAEEFSSKALELEFSFGRSQEGFSVLSAELDDCKNLVISLQVENEALNGTLVSLTEEKNKLSDEKEFSLHENEKLLMELTRCNELVASLEAKNEMLNATLASVTEEQKQLVEDKESSHDMNEKLLVELAECKNLVTALQMDNSDLSGTLSLIREERERLEEQKELLSRQNQDVSVEFDECKRSLASIKVENSNLNASLASITEDNKKLEDDRKHFVHETERLSSELLDLQEHLSKERGDCMQLELDVKELTARIEQLMGENMFLHSSLDLHKAKLTELDSREGQIAEVESQVRSVQMSSIPATHDGNSHQVLGDEASSALPTKPLYDEIDGDSSLELLDLEVFNDSCGFVGLKRHIDETEKLLERFEKAIEGLHSHSASLNQSDGVGGVSKLIQAFEHKAHNDEDEVEERVSNEFHLSVDPFMAMKGLVGDLRAVVKLIGLDAEKASKFFRVERDGRRSVKSCCNELTVQCEALLERGTCLEAINIELGVLYEVAKLHASEVEEKKNELEVIYEAFKLRENSLISENTELGTKLSDYNELRVQYEALLEHTNSLETINIELGVLYEATKLHASEVEANKNELEIIYEALKLRESSLKSENTELGTKLSDYELKICEMQSQFNDFQGRSDEMAAVLRNELESLHKEVAGREVSLEEGWSSAVTQIFETVTRLEKSVGKYLNPNVLSGTHGILDRSNGATVSVSVVIEVIENVVQKLEAGFSDWENISNSYRELDEKFRDLLAKNELAVAILHKVYGDLSKLVIDSCVLGYEPTMRSQIEELDDPFDYNNYKPVIDQLESLFGQKLELQSVNSQLSSELMSRTKHVEKLSTQCLDLNGIQKLIADVEAVLKLEDSGTDSDRTPSSHLESLVSLLVQKYKEIGEQELHGEEFGYKVMESTDIPENTQQLDALKLQQEFEILTLKESLHQAEEALHVAASKLQGKISELEQSEQRVSSIREKLSIAVAKGKGLIVQRDSLKQSLAETSSELDRCSQELQLKDARVEALESELSYIRNSATAIRESFLLKDSVLQRIEEILEDLDLSEHFHSGDIIEKVDWLARSAAANPSHPTDWEPKSFVEASSPDSGFVTVDAWKEDAHPDSNSGEELRRQFEELQRKFFESAEQNEMLEQSLMERNHLVQRWEELLNQIHMPPHLRTMEPEDRIEWLGSALLEASNERDSIQRKIDNLEDFRGSLTADLEDSHQKVSDLQADLQSVIHERQHLSERLQALLSDHDELSAKVVHAELENERLQAEVTGLQDKLVEKLESEKRLLSIEGSISRLESLVSDALQDPGMSGLVSGGGPLEFFEDLVKQLIERYTTLKSVSPLLHVTAEEDNKAADETLVDSRSRDALPVEETEVASLKKQLEEALQDLVSMKEERDRYSEKEQSFLGDVQELSKKREELLELLNQEEHKSASLREKLNVAVRKGKSVVQQRDTLKQTLENMNSELERLKSEISRYENSIADYEQKIRELSSYHERAEALESENSFLSKRLEETEHYLQERERTLTPVLNKLADINFDVVMHTSDPVEKLEKIVKLCFDLNSAVASSKQESSKSRRATELLLAELNEVQERNDGLQEELAKATSELTELMKERDVAEAAKFEALSHAQKLSSIHAEEERKKRSETLVLKSSLNQVRGGLADIFNLLSDTFSSNLNLLKDLEASIVSCLKGNDAGEVVSSSFYNASGAVSSRSSQNKESARSLDSWTNANLPDQFDDNFTADAGDLVAHHLQEFMNEIGALKEKLNVHLKSLEGQASSVSSVVGVLQRERASQKESFEALKGEILHLESTGREKDIEIAALSRNISLLYEACANAITEIENRKTELLKNNLFAEEPVKYADPGLPFSRQTDFSSEEYVKTMANRIISAVNEFAATKSDFAVDGLKEMKITVANLQKELQEKDIQKDRICMELVAQIKKAEAAAADYSREYHSSKALACDLEKQVEQMQRERESLEQRVKELHDVQATSMELQNRVGSLTEKLSAKDQEIDALMQALDEEEVQMEELRRKIEGLEEVLQKKNVDLENLIASRAKVVKKLAITVSRFDELHDLSENLLSEVEKLQSQLQDRDAEISFLRNEVTRCTNDVLTASKMNSKRASEDIYELLTWLDAVVSRVEIPEVHVDDNNNIQAHEHKEVLQKRINTIISQLEDLQVVARSKDALLQAEKSKVEELVRREETLEKTLHEKESQLNLLQSTRDSGQAAGFNSEIVEVEPVVNKWAVAGTSTASQVRSLRKGNNDQVAIAIDMDNGTSDRLEDEDDDKVHGFKSLTTSRIIPRFTRPVTDMVDGLWVSCDRALMRQPALRLCIMMYWAVLHAMLAAFVF